jgi:hypothetical protein
MQTLRTASEQSPLTCLKALSFVLVHQPGLMQAVMAVLKLKPWSITVLEEVGWSKDVVISQHGDEGGHRVDVTGQKLPIA